MGYIEVAHLTQITPDGVSLLDDVSFRVGEGVKAALIGPNGAGKTTLFKILTGDVAPTEGIATTTGGMGVMRQFIGSIRSAWTVRDLLLSVASARIQQVAKAHMLAEAAVAATPDEPQQMAYAQAIADYADAGGYDVEVLWDTCTVAALGLPLDRCVDRPVSALSGGEQKRLVLEVLLRGPDQVILLDEPDNYLDVPAKHWLEQQLRATTKTVLLISHDRELLANVADRIITLEDGRVWVHGGGFSDYAQARAGRMARLDEVRRRWEEEHLRLRDIVKTLQQRAQVSDAMASRLQAAQSRLRRFVEAGPPQAPPREQDIKMRLSGGRTGKRALTCKDLELTSLMEPFDLEVFYGERVAVLGSNGSGKSHFLRLLAGQPVAHDGSVQLGARVVAGHFAQTHACPELLGHSALRILVSEHGLSRGEAMAALARYGLTQSAERPFERLSGGQQARLQILLLELSGATLLLLDEPTDNLDLASAEALQEGLQAFSGTVLAVTHDRWFARSFDRFLVFRGDGRVQETDTPVWDEARVSRAR